MEGDFVVINFFALVHLRYTFHCTRMMNVSALSLSATIDLHSVAWLLSCDKKRLIVVLLIIHLGRMEPSRTFPDPLCGGCSLCCSV